MRLYIPKMPSERNRQIYKAVYEERKRQADVAKQFNISQGRVAQICRDVRQWMGLNVHEHKTGPAHELYLTARERRVHLEEQWRRASAAFDQSLQSDVQVKTSTRNDVKYREDKMSKYGKANHHMFGQMVRLEELIYKAKKEEIAAESAALEANRAQRQWLEEDAVRQGLKMCRDLKATHPEVSEFGMQVDPLPELDEKQVEAHARAQSRRFDHEGEPLMNRLVSDYLPQAWREQMLQMTNDVEPFKELLPPGYPEEIRKTPLRPTKAGNIPTTPGKTEPLRKQVEWYKASYAHELERRKKAEADLKHEKDARYIEEQTRHVVSQKPDLCPNNSNKVPEEGSKSGAAWATEKLAERLAQSKPVKAAKAEKAPQPITIIPPVTKADHGTWPVEPMPTASRPRKFLTAKERAALHPAEQRRSREKLRERARQKRD